MTGDIRGAWNVDTDVTSLSGTELVTNGTFATDTTGWVTNSDGAISIDGGKLKILNVTNRGRFYHSGTFPLVTGKHYVLKFDAITGSTTGFFHINTGGGWVYNLPLYDDYYFTANGTAGDIEGGVSSTAVGAYTYFDNISIKEAIPDRSVKGNGLAVYGTPTVSAVATGAELKCISGFSTSNYLQQPYNADLDFGTGDFSFSCWMKSSSTGGAQYLFKRSSGSRELEVWIAADLAYVAFYTGGVSLTSGNDAFGDNVWSYVTALRTGGTKKIYINGVEKSSVASTVSVNFTGATEIGYSATSTKIALPRISATAPTAEQIKEIYEAEKPLFQENAKCTLGTYPSDSSSVTAMAYDDSTDLLHVGTSNGRSTFKGLRRVEQTTPNTTEIAAQGGLIVEETD
jgi:hypothetical protein